MPAWRPSMPLLSRCKWSGRLARWPTPLDAHLRDTPPVDPGDLEAVAFDLDRVADGREPAEPAADPPADQILHVDDADDMIEIVVEHRETREVMLPRGRDELRDRRVLLHGDDLGPRDHHLANDAVGELHRPPDDHALALLKHALARADRHKHLELLLAVNAQLGARPNSHPEEQRVGARVDQRDERIHEPEEEIEGVRAP